MSIEQMKKDDLVKEVRRLTQELKLKQTEVDALLINEKASNDNNEQIVKDLPYLAVSIVKKSPTEHKIYQIRFNLNGDAKVDLNKTTVVKEGYRAGYEAAKLMETIVASQEEK